MFAVLDFSIAEARMKDTSTEGLVTYDIKVIDHHFADKFGTIFNQRLFFLSSFAAFSKKMASVLMCKDKRRSTFYRNFG